MTRSMQHELRMAFHMILSITVFCAATPSWGQEETAGEMLARAIQLYEAGAYEEALPVLEGTDPGLLSAEDQELLRWHVKLANRAVAGYRLALADLARAEDAIDEQDFNLAKTQLDRVLQNQFATDGLRVEARDDLAKIARGERDRILLASAAAQEDPTQDQPSTTRPQPPSANTRPTMRKPVVNDFSPTQQANMLVRHANQAMQRGSNQIADDYFRQALDLVPGHPDATDGLRQLKMHQRVESGASEDGITLIDRIKQRNAILWQRAVAVFRTAERDIQESVANDRYDEAQRSLQLARETIESARQYADPISNYHGLKAELAAVREQVDAREQTYNEQRAVQLRQKLQEEELIRRSSLEAERTRQIDLLMEEVDNRVDDRDFFGAAQVVRQILVIDPKDTQAARLIEEFEDIASVRSQQDSRVLLEKEMRDIFEDVEVSKIPWHQDLNYPDNWQELIRSPYRKTPGEFPLDEIDGVFEESFRGRIPDISFNQVPLEQAIERLSDERDINIVPNWPDLASAGITRSTPVTLKLRNVTTKTALTQVVDQLQGLSLAPLNFAVRGGIIKVATENFLNRDVFVRVYAVQDLIHPIEQYDDAPEFDLRRPQRDRRKASRRDKAIFAKAEALTDEEPLENRTDNMARRELTDLVGLIEEHVAPLSWEAHGGPARIHARLDGNLVITQTAASHQEIFNLLDQLRQDRAIQIAIEARFLTVSSNFLEDMGVDLNIVLNNGNAGFDQALVGNSLATDPATGSQLLLPRGFSRLGFTPSTPGFGTGTGNNQTPDQPFLNPVFVPRATGGSNVFTPFPISSGSRGFTDPGRETSDVPGSFAGGNLAPALQIAGSFLDNIQVDFLLRATQADARTSTMIAPKLILTNGQQAWIAVTEQQNYVSELDPVVATGAAAQRPVTDTLDTGAVLNVQATASPDRRYVMMNLQPGVGRLVAVNTFQFSGGPITGVGAPGFVQLPIVQRQQVKTTVTVPDGGTLLVGGQKLTFEKESDAGVPVLSKIPLLKRLYSSRAIIKDEQVLLILIKPQILIQEELEEKANPMLGSLR